MTTDIGGRVMNYAVISTKDCRRYQCYWVDGIKWKCGYCMRGVFNMAFKKLSKNKCAVCGAGFSVLK